MKDTPLMEECRELIAFYDKRGANWESALSFTLFREMFGSAARIARYDDGEYIVRHRYRAQTAKAQP